MADLIGLRPDLAPYITQFETDAQQRVGPALHALLAARVAQLHGDDETLASIPDDVAGRARQWDSDALSSAERAALAVCESFVIDAHAVSDREVAQLQAAVGDDVAVAIFLDLALLDGFTKFRRVFSSEGTR
jgi:hypothetical protein